MLTEVCLMDIDFSLMIVIGNASCLARFFIFQIRTALNEDFSIVLNSENASIFDFVFIPAIFRPAGLRMLNQAY